MIGIIGAMNVEVEQLLAKMENRSEHRIGLDTFTTGTLYGCEAVLTICGPGKINAALCAQSMIVNFHPKWILNTGVAGSGEEGITVGDMVVASATVQHDVDTTGIGDPICMVSKVNKIFFECDEKLRARLVAAAKTLEGVKVVEGIIATGDQFINKGDVRARIHSITNCKAVEMEGGAIAHACYIHGTPCAVLRSISDSADGHADMDYPTFTHLAADRTQAVVAKLLADGE